MENALCPFEWDPDIDKYFENDDARDTFLENDNKDYSEEDLDSDYEDTVDVCFEEEEDAGYDEPWWET